MLFLKTKPSNNLATYLKVDERFVKALKTFRSDWGESSEKSEVWGSLGICVQTIGNPETKQNLMVSAELYLQVWGLPIIDNRDKVQL